MDRETAAEARAVLAATRAWLEEWVEDGLDRFERDAEPVAPAPGPEPEPVREAAPEVPPRARDAAGAAASPGPRPNPSPQPTPAAVPARQPALLGTTSPLGPSPTLASVREALGECTRCRLHEGRRQIVFGDGNPEADLLFVGEGPGAEEDRRGVPFVGRAGELLTAMIEKGLGIPRSEVYICNIVKCRPPQNRTPLADEASTCRPFLDGQIAAVRPKVIVALGKPATSLLLGRDVPITRVRGTWHDYQGTPLMPTYHPAFVLRQYTPENRRLVWDDLKAALARVREG